MAGFQIDMSPLERSSMNIGRSLVDIGRTVGGAIQQSRQEGQQAQEQGDIEAFMRQAMSGDPVALEELMIKSPQAAQMVAQHLQQQQATQQGQDEQFKTQIAQDTAGFIEQMHTAPEDQQEAMFNAAVDDPRFDIDEEDRNLFMDTDARKAIIGQVKGKDYAEAFFGKPKEATKYQQGTGEMAGHVFNPDTGTFSINPEIRANLDALSVKPKLDFKDRQSLNKDITNLTKETKLIRNTASDLDKLAKVRSGPAAIAMIFKFMKALDPTSVVRESEFAMAESAAGMPEAIKNTFDKVWAGEKLGDEQIKQFVATAKNLANNAINSSGTEVSSFLDTFEGTIPESFKSKIKERLPKPFEMAAAQTPTNIAPENKQAYNWAKANPNDPRAAQILERIGAN